MTFAIDYKLTGTGWAECTISSEATNITISASYLSDALGALVKSTCHLLDGATEQKFSFDEEPGEYRWILSVANSDKLDVKILEFPELWSNAPDSEGKVIFEATCLLNDFGRAVLTALKQLIERHGVDGYNEQWAEHLFPQDDYANLESLIKKNG